MSRGRKIVGLVILLLVLMMAAVGVSVKLIVNVAKEVENVAGKQLPIADHVSRISEIALQQRIAVQKLSGLAADRETNERRINEMRKRFDALGQQAVMRFSIIHKEINVGGKPILPALHKNLAISENLYLKYNNDAQLLAATLEAGDRESFRALLPELDSSLNNLALEIEDFRRNMAKVAEKSLAVSAERRKRAWTANTVLMALAVILGLGLATLIVRRIS